MSETHLTITIPGNVSPTTIGPLRDRLEHAVQSVLATPCEIREGAVALQRDDARVAGYAMLTALRFHEIFADAFTIPPLRHAGRIRQLVTRLVGDAETYVERREPVSIAAHADDLQWQKGLSRPQETRADAIASEFGRSHVRPLADGAVEITGLTDDVERVTVCVEPDGRERWRR